MPVGRSPRLEDECVEVLVLVHSYVDGECDVDTALAIATHLDVCPACGNEVLCVRWLKAAVRRCGQSAQNPS